MDETHPAETDALPCGCRGCDVFDCGLDGCACCWSENDDDLWVYAPRHPRDIPPGGSDA